jgi:hypothetical protein
MNYLIRTDMKQYTVWVGGVEVNDVLLDKNQAENLAFEYEAEGYDDVIIEEIL